jgi:hypothetical protein
MNNKDLKKDLYSATIVISIGLIITCSAFIYFEINDAKKSCQLQDMVYEFELPYNHLCNNESYFKYSNGWDFEREFNYSKFSNKNKLIIP